MAKTPSDITHSFKKIYSAAQSGIIVWAEDVSAPDVSESKASADTFKIEDVPFYRAVQLFEAEQYLASFPIFLECALNGNLYAPFYLRAMLRDAVTINLKLTPEQQTETKRALEFIDKIPTQFRPQSWHEASQQIIELAKAKHSPKKEEINKIVSSLLMLSEFASNASVALYNHSTDSQKPDIQKITKVTRHLSRADLYALHFVMTRKSKFPVVSARHLQEWEFVNQHHVLAKQPIALIETMISRSYNGDITFLNGVQKKTFFQTDLRRKFEWQNTAAHMGNRDIQLIFANPSPTKDKMMTEEMPLWLLMAALNNEPQAQMQMSLHFYYGKNPKFAINHIRAREFLQKSLTHRDQRKVTINSIGLVSCLITFGLMHEYGEGGLEINEKEALKYYLRADALNNPRASQNVGVFYEHGKGELEKNYHLAVQYYKKAIALYFAQIDLKAEKESINIKENIAKIECYVASLLSKGGHGLDKNLAEAAEYYKKSSPYCIVSRAEYGAKLYWGIDVPKNEKEGLTLMIEAADQGVIPSAWNVAQLFFCRAFKLDDYGINKDKILDYCLLAKDRYPMLISFMVPIYLDKKNYSEAHKWLILGMSYNQSLSFGNMGYLHGQGCPELKIEQDYKKAYEFYQKAIELDNSSAIAISNKGYLHLHGLGCNKDYAEAKRLFEQSLTLGDKMAAFNLYSMYRKGLGVESDLRKAFELLKIAEETQDLDVFYSLGLCYALGRGVEEDQKIAFEYVKKAALKGHVVASLTYAFYRIRAGIESNELNSEIILEAYQLLKLPCEAGYSRAIFLAIMIRLICNPNDVAESHDALLKLNQAQQRKPSVATSIAIEVLTKRGLLKPIEILSLIYRHDLASITDLDKLTESRQTQSKIDSDVSPNSSRSTPAANGSAPARLIAPHSSDKTFSLKSQRRLYSQLDQMLDPLNTKNINIKELKKIIAKIDSQGQVAVKISKSKGSNTNYKVNIRGNKPLCFSYHPAHRANSSADSELDRGRARSIQKFVGEIRADLARIS